jgi:hypothetical protein
MFLPVPALQLGIAKKKLTGRIRVSGEQVAKQFVNFRGAETPERFIHRSAVFCQAHRRKVLLHISKTLPPGRQRSTRIYLAD